MLFGPLLVAAALAAPAANLRDELRSTVTLGALCAQACPSGSMALGAGEIVGRTSDGVVVVLTARHVIDGASALKVYLRNGAWPGIDMESFSKIGVARTATLLAYSMDLDLALVGFRPHAVDDFAVAPLGTTDDGIDPGVVVGDPYGSLWTYSTYRFLDRAEATFDFDCQTCGPGDSGGGVFDGSGDLQGIVVRQRVEGDGPSDGARTSQFQAISLDVVRRFIGDARAHNIVVLAQGPGLSP